jgi:hypothetical protein
MYAWGTADAAKLDRVVRLSGSSELTIHMRDLVDAFGQGVVNYVDDVADHPEKHQRFLEASGQWMGGIPLKVVDDFLEADGPNPDAN